MQDSLNKLDQQLEQYLVKRAPALPQDIVKLLVTLAPWFALITVIFGIPAIVAAFGVTAFVTPFAIVAGARTGSFWFYWLLSLVQIGLSGLAIKPLFARAMRGWQLMFYSQLLSLVSSLFHFNVLNLALTVLSFYLLYQMKKSYK